MLWNRSLVMRDLETGSLWSHILGRAMAGKLRGKELDVIPSTITDWKTWQQAHPETTVVMLSRTAREFNRQMYRDPAKFVIGLSDRNTAKAWPYDQLILQPIVNDRLNDEPVVVFFDERSGAAVIYDRRVNGRALSFVLQDDKIVDEQTGSSWNWMRGEANGGELKSEQLKPRPGVISFTKAWQVFHPNSSYWKAADN